MDSSHVVLSQYVWVFLLLRLSCLAHLFIFQESMFITSFKDFLSCHDQAIVKEALEKCSSTVVFQDDMTTSLISIFKQFCCRHRPTPQNVRSLIIQIARHEFLTKPLAALNSLHSGVPACHAGFWDCFSVDQLLYNASRGPPKHIINKLIEPPDMDSNQVGKCKSNLEAMHYP